AGRPTIRVAATARVAGQARSQPPNDRHFAALAPLLGEAEALREIQHAAIGAHDLAVERAVACRARGAAQALKQRAAQALALPGVRDDQREFRRLAVGIGRIAPHGDELAALQRYER